VRIIAGRWRGRKLAVPSAQGLRPTGDRVRETLFNWLQADVAGAHCLDLFAGSGALGFEALSRYARHVVFVETDPDVCRALEQAGEQLGVVNQSEAVWLADADSPCPGPIQSGIKSSEAQAVSQAAGPSVHIHCGSAAFAIDRWQSASHSPTFNLVFIDPPFDSACQWDMLDALVPTLLADGALIYLESPAAEADEMRLPEGCQLVREKRFGEVMARLVRYSGSS